jgi:iron-sulfur cluster assembly protein
MVIFQSPVKISPAALSEIKKILESKNIPGHYGLRIGIKDAGTGTVSHILGFDEINESDSQFSAEGLTVYIRKTEVLPLAGYTLDYYNGPEARGFVFRKGPGGGNSEK